LGGEKVKTKVTNPDTAAAADAPELARDGDVDFQDPEVVLSVLEADQVVAAKSQTRFGRRKLSLGVELLLWGLRIYVIVMLVIVFVYVLRALHGTT
jgi:hypothetical protein